MLVKELCGLITNRYLIYKIQCDDFEKKYNSLPRLFYDFEVVNMYFHHNEFCNMLDIKVKKVKEL